MGRRAMPCVFGPVPSRRLGWSLGVNNLAGKHCSYSCVYCQAGRTRLLADGRCAFAPAGEVRAAVEAALATARVKGVPVDVVSFVPTGEPTLDARLGEAIRAIKGLGVRVAVITNGSLLWRPDVRDELADADWVSVKLDAATEEVWRGINRPHGRLSFHAVLDGVLQFADLYRGTLVTETMLVEGLNDAPADIDALSRRLALLAPSTVWLAAPTRPPAERWVRRCSASGFDRVLSAFRDRLPQVRPLFDGGDAPFSTLGAERDRLLALLAVHPLRETELKGVLRAAGASWRVVDALSAEGRVEAVTFEGVRFYRLVQPRGRARRPS